MAELLVIAALASAVFTLAALAQAASGFGAALVAVPLLAFVIGPAPALVATTMASLALTAGAWRREAGHADRGAVRRLTLAGVLGMPLGLVVLIRLDEEALTAVIAVVVLGAVAVLAAGVSPAGGVRGQWGAGLASGALLTSTGMNGPPLVLVLQDREPRPFRATLQAVFCCQDAVAVGAFLVLGQVTAPSIAAFVGGVVGIPAGWALGDAVFRRLSPARFRGVVLGGLAATGAAALASALL